VKKLEAIPIGELPRLTGVNIETIRYYEKIKVLQRPPRTQGGHRIYAPTDTRVLAFIRRYGQETILVTANLAATRQSCELRLSSALTPVDGRCCSRGHARTPRIYHR
jgi:DNA-binding transcriptional MerR regulator